MFSVQYQSVSLTLESIVIREHVHQVQSIQLKLIKSFDFMLDWNVSEGQSMQDLLFAVAKAIVLFSDNKLPEVASGNLATRIQ